MNEGFLQPEPPFPWLTWPAAPRIWNDTENATLTCMHVARETHDVKTFSFAAIQPRHFSFLPGQFIIFTFPLPTGVVHRCYTIASPPTRPNRISITVKRTGPVSAWLHDTLAPGMHVEATGPLGDFTCFRNPPAKYLFLSGGSGITPLMSMARALADLASPMDIAFLHSARTPDDIIFRAELTAIAGSRPEFRFIPVCESDSPTEAWTGYRGRLSSAMLRIAVPDVLERQIYTCGPDLYMAAMRSILNHLGFPFSAYHEESFVFAAQDATPPHPGIEAEGFTVEFARTQQSITCRSDQTVLESAQQSGMKLPFSCARGLCGTCKTRLVSGKVDMQHAGGIRPREIDNGLVLLCCSKPLSNLVVDR